MVLLPMDIPQKRFVREHCGNLWEFVERMKMTLWEDWEVMCHGNCMEGRRAKSLVQRS